MRLHRHISIWACVGVWICLGACSSKYKDISGDPVSSESVQSAIQSSHVKSVDILDEVRGTVRAVFGNSLDPNVEITLVHVPMTTLKGVQFEQDGALYRSRKEWHDLGSAFMAYAGRSEIQVSPYSPPYRVLILSEEIPYVDEGAYYLSKEEDGQAYFYAVGVDVESARRLGISFEGVNEDELKAISDAEIHPIVLLKKERLAVTDPGS